MLRGSAISKAAIIAHEAKLNHGTLLENDKLETSLLYQKKRELEGLLKDFSYARWLLRYVGDGIAWHALDFDRPLIRALGSRGPVNVPGQAVLIKHRKFMRQIRLKTGRAYLPIMHDITNCLRTDDVSIAGGAGIQTIELKIREPQSRTSRKGTLSQREKRQVTWREKIRRYLATGNMEEMFPKLKGGKLYRSKVQQKHNFAYISDAFLKAREEGVGIVEPETGLLYIVINLEKSSETEALDKAVKLFPSFFDSLTTFRSISPRMDEYHDSLPITAMQLAPSDILSLLSRKYALFVLLNFGLFEKECIRLGLHLVVNNLEPGGIQIISEEEPRLEIQQGTWDKIMLEAFSIRSMVETIKDLKNIVSANPYESMKQE